jgi:hypothetical protein
MNHDPQAAGGHDHPPSSPAGSAAFRPPPGPHPSAAPPTTPGPLASRPQRSAWPALLGILGIVFGAVGLAMRLLSTVVLIVMRSSGGGDPEASSGGARAGFQAAAAAEWFIPLMATYAVGAVLSLALLAGSIALLRRRPIGVRVLMVWAIAKIVMAFPDSAMAYLVQRDQGALPFGAAAPTFTAIWTFAWAVILPIIFLAVLSSSKSRDEVAGWKGKPG